MARSKKPKRKVSPARRRARREARLLKREPLLNPGATLAGTALRKGARSVTNAEFDPKIAAVRTAGRNAQTQGTALVDRNDSYYRQLAEGEAGRVARQKALGAELDASLSAVNRDTSTGLDKAEAAARAAQAADAEVRGTSGAGDRQLLDELAAQRARAAGNAQTFRSSAAGDTASYGGLVNAMGGARASHGAETHRDLTTRLANQQADYRAQEQTLKGQKAEAGVKNLLNLRQSSFENAATLRGLGLKEADINATQAKAERELSLARRRQREVERNNRRNAGLAQGRIDTTKRGQDLSHSDRQAALDDRKNKKDKPKAESQSSKNTKLAIDNARSSVRRYRTQGLTGPQITKKARQAKIPPVVLNAARDLEYLGYVSAPNAAALKRAGVRVPGSWLRRPGARRGASRGRSRGERPT